MIIGKLPPPIGGVRIHVQRLITTLESRGVPFDFFDLSKKSMVELLWRLPGYHLIHLHTSNPWLQLIVATACRLTGTSSIITYHGNLGRFQCLRNFATNLSILLILQPIVLNAESLEIARKWNRKALIISAYIPPSDDVPLAPEILISIQKHQNGYVYTFCTNASAYSVDKAGNEIYGISDLIDHFGKLTEACLIVSDPSGNYAKLYEDTRTQLPKNVLLIPVSHDFCTVLKYADAFIRNTTTDGMSISIAEALAAGKTVFASNAVSRPACCIVYQQLANVNFVEELTAKRLLETPPAQPDVPEALAQIYTSILASHVRQRKAQP